MPVEIGIERLVFQLRDEKGLMCTGFYLPWGSQKYIVTAKHFLQKPKVQVTICIDEKWLELPSKVIHCSRDDIDISAIDISESRPFNVNDILLPEYTCENVFIGDDCFFLGFPYGIKSVFGFKDAPFAKLTFPLVKRATVSAGIMDSQNTNIGFYMDGHNNPGFSGGPCLKRAGQGKWTLFGVVSSYIPQENILYDEENRVRMILNENSGIFICGNIIHFLIELPK